MKRVMVLRVEQVMICATCGQEMKTGPDGFVVCTEHGRWAGVGSAKEIDDHEAWFHEFSVDSAITSDDGVANTPVAIVERDDGRVELVYAKHIRFLPAAKPEATRRPSESKVRKVLAGAEPE